MTAGDLELMNKELTAHTDVQQLIFRGNPHSGVYEMRITLVGAPDQSRLTLECAGVGQLSVRHFGGGITQLLCLHITDISDRHLDRLNYEVRDLERGNLECVCRDVSVERTGANDEG